MSGLKTSLPRTDDGHIDSEQWLAQCFATRGDEGAQMIRQAVMLAKHTGESVANLYGVSCFQQGLEIAEILLPLNMDEEALSAAILYGCVQYADLGIDDVSEQVSAPVALIIDGTRRMDAIHISHGRLSQSAQLSSSIDNLRKMMLSMVDDIRVVLVKLAERVIVMRHIAPLGDAERQTIAQETLDIFAPLANRLGIAQVKWLLEDYAFRYLQSERYKTIAKSLKMRRNEREYYVEKMVSEIQSIVQNVAIQKFEVYGRAKHIYSIYKKMQRKHVPIEEVFDVIAIRVLVPSIEDCYTVLGLVQEKWQPIANEFDDYIAHPKPNGYQSIHTAVLGPDERVFEVQIRTFDMHAVAELGVAAHWMYKEGKHKQSSYEAKIDWLRNVMAWQQEISEGDEKEGEALSHIFDDRVYVFTPMGDVMDLQRGATSLDFAYLIHSEVGNRCRGAKVNGKLEPLTYQLKMGDKVEVLTEKNARPSRDWLNPHAGYLATSKAKSKVLHYFRQQDFERHLSEGEELFNKESKRLHVNYKIHPELLKRLNLKTKEDLFAAMGRGDIGVVTVINALENLSNKGQTKTPGDTPIQPAVAKPIKRSGGSADLSIAGQHNLLSKMAQCCKPIPGDPVIGYITFGSGVSIHRQDCRNVVHNLRMDKNRLVEVNWGASSEESYTADLRVTAHDRRDLLKEISQLITASDVGLLGLNCAVDKREQLAHISITLEVDGVHPLDQLLTKLRQIEGVVNARRQS